VTEENNTQDEQTQIQTPHVQFQIQTQSQTQANINRRRSRGNTLPVIVFGAGGVGKSSIILRFMSGTFVDEYDPTIEDRYKKTLVVDDKPVVLDIVDTAGQDSYKPLLESYMTMGEGFLLVYDITNPMTFRYVQRVAHELLDVKMTPFVPIVFVGNKIDLPDRKVTFDEAKELAQTYEHCAALETSAKENVNITEAFEAIVKKIWSLRGGPPKKSRHCNLL
jgi:GTPase KRas protein